MSTKSCDRCYWHDIGRCYAPKSMRNGMLADISRSFGWFYSFFVGVCGKTGRWFKPKQVYCVDCKWHRNYECTNPSYGFRTCPVTGKTTQVTVTCIISRTAPAGFGCTEDGVWFEPRVHHEAHADVPTT